MAPTAALRRTARRLAVSSLKATAAVADLGRGPTAGITVLLYHQVGGGRPGEVNLDPARFDEQVSYLANRAGVTALGEAVELLRGGAGPVGASPLPRHVLTFDDGTADFVERALPVLVGHGAPVTLYVATRWVEEERSFWDDGTVLTWSMLREALSTGLVTVGSHTHSHVLLDRLAPGQIDDELDRSKGLIEDRLGVPCEHFAYPKALEPSPAAAAAVAARFRSAALAGTRPNPYGRTDVQRLARSPVQVSDGMRWFRHKAAGGMWFEDRARQVANRRRYAGAQR